VGGRGNQVQLEGRNSEVSHGIFRQQVLHPNRKRIGMGGRKENQKRNVKSKKGLMIKCVLSERLRAAVTRDEGLQETDCCTRINCRLGVRGE